MRKFREYLKEMAIAGYGDWEPSKEMIGTITEFILNKKWNKIEDVNIKGTGYTVYRLKDTYILGRMLTSTEGEKEYEIDFEIELKEHKSIANSFGIKQRLMNVDGVRVQESKQGRGISTFMYTFLVKKEKLNILGDEIQYFGARKLWSKLSKLIDIRVDIVDISKDEYLEKDVILYHGTNDWDFDLRVWDYTPAKKDIRLILKDIL